MRYDGPSQELHRLGTGAINARNITEKDETNVMRTAAGGGIFADKAVFC